MNERKKDGMKKKRERYNGIGKKNKKLKYIGNKVNE